MKLFWNNLLIILKKLLLPPATVAGLEIKDTAIRIAQFQDGEFKKAVVSLEPGVIDGGRIKNKDKFIESLRELRKDFSGEEKKIPVVVVVPSVDFFSQDFSAPALTGSKLEEAAQLNLQALSPTDFNSVYSDWHQIGVSEKDGKIDILGAFIESEISDEYVFALGDAGFIAVAMEFPALAQTRIIKEMGAEIDLTKPLAVLNIASDGIDFMIVRQGNLYFHYFAPWKGIGDDGNSREISFADFQETIIRELKRVFLFYGNHWSGKIENLILISQSMNVETEKFIKETFNLNVIDLRLRNLTDLSSAWFTVLGAALRGKLPRSKDTIVSLMMTGTERMQVQGEILSFIETWRNVFITTLGFLLILFIATDSFFANYNNNLTIKAQSIKNNPGGAEILEVENQARLFNQLVNKAGIASGKSMQLYPVLSKIDTLIRDGIEIQKLSIVPGNFNSSLGGTAKSESQVIKFRDGMVKENFREVSLLLSNIVTNQDGSVTFSLTFKLP